MEKSEETVREVLQKKVNLNAYQGQKQTHWARKAGSLRQVEREEKIPTQTELAKPRT
jgi:hypothetical protein